MTAESREPLVPLQDEGAERVFRRPLAVVAVLAGVAGYVDAFAYLWLGVFVANMTGNIVFLGLALGGESTKGWESALALAGFALGAAAGVGLRSWGRRRGAPAGTVAPLVVECVLLAAVVVTVTARTTDPDGLDPGSATSLVALVALAAANGLQAFVITRIAGITTPTTYATGTVVASSSAAFAAVADRRTQAGAVWRRRWAVAVTTPASYLLGAAAYAVLREQRWATVLPLAVMLGVLVLAVADRGPRAGNSLPARPPA